MIEAGRVLSERYRLIRPLGQGSQAAVWVADHLALQTHVAVKLIDPELAKREDARERFKREATAAAQLRSAHVVQILDHGIDGTQPFIVMELLDGEDLFERLNSKSRLTLRETSRVITQVARALTRAHQAGIVHRDLKPENVFLVPNDDDDEIAKVLDFGVAKVSDPAKQTMRKTGVGTLVGTPHYMSPEQVKGIGEVDSRSDLWSLGVIAFQCVTGELPFDSEGVGDLLIKISMSELPVPSDYLASIPPSFDAWFAKACARDVEERFQTARAMALALAAIAGMDTVKKPSMRPPSMTGAGEHRPSSSPFIDEDEFEEVVDKQTQPTLTASQPPPPPRSRGAAPSRPKPRPPLRADVEASAMTPPSVPLIARPGPAVGHGGSTVDGLARSRPLQTDPPPELDGTKRRRLTTWFVALFALAALAIAFTVIRSQLIGNASVPPPPTTKVAGPAPIEPPVVVNTATEMPPTMGTAPAEPTEEAVDPGKLTHPVSTTPKPSAAPRPRRRRPRNDGTVNIPDPVDDE